MTANEALDKFGHADEDETRQTAEALGVKITRGKMKPCPACAAAKAKQKSVPKISDHVPATEGERRIFLDISTVKKPKDLPAVIRPNWRIMVDERTQMKFSAFFEKKNAMVEPTCVQLNKWKDANKMVKYIRMG